MAALVAPVLKNKNATPVGIHVTGPWTGGQDVNVAGQVHPVAYCTSVLAVREALDQYTGDGEPALVLLTPLPEDELGWDVLVRLAARRLLPMAPWNVVRDLFRAHSVDPRITPHPWIAEILLDRTPASGYPPVPSGVLDADTAWSHVLDRTLGLRTGRPDADALLEASLDPAFASRYEHLPDDAKAALSARIEDTAGRLGGLLVAALEAQRGRWLLPIGLACDVLFPGGQAGEVELGRAAVRLEPYVGGAAVEPILGLRWAEAARRVLDHVPDSERAVVHQQTEDLLREVRADAFVGLSTVLPTSYQHRLQDFGNAIFSFLAGDAGTNEMQAELSRVEQHRQAQVDGEKERMGRLRMAVRLVRYLESRSRGEAAIIRSLSDAARTYAEGGSYVDWARTLLLGGDQDGTLATALNALSERVRQHREQENNVFAKRLAEWNRSPSVETGFVPIEHVLDEVVVPAAAKAPVLVLLLDGMGFASFHQLHQELSQTGWEEWAVEGRKDRVVALSTAPSITRISRASFFSGRLISGASAEEKRRFGQHLGLVSASKPKKPPRLFHKGALTEGAASGLSETVREAIRDADQRVVGIVLNVLDDSLAKSDQMLPRWTPDRIRLLEPILFEARIAGRLVVLASDHGHVLETDGRALPGGDEERWRTYEEPVAPEEIILSGPRIQAATGATQIIAPWSEQVRYVRKKAGYHGGASPQEMLVPIAVLASWDRPVDGLTPVLEKLPHWWSVSEERDEPAQIAKSEAAPRLKHRQAIQHPSLFSDAPLPAAPPPSDWITELLTSPAFQSQRDMAGRTAPPDDTVRAFLELLANHHGRVSRSALSHALGMPETRTRGVLAGLQRLLNVDGYPIVVVDEEADTIELQQDMLRKQFQVGK